MTASGRAARMSLTTGNAWITSPMELVLIRAIRKRGGGSEGLERQRGVGRDREDRTTEIVLYARERGLVSGLESQDDDGRGVRRPCQPEAVRVLGPDAVDGDHFRRALELRLVAQLLDEGEVLSLGRLELQLGRGGGIRERVEPAARVGLAREDLEQPGAGVQPVVEAVPALLEEDVAAHLAGERRAGLAQLRLDQRVPGPPHERLAAMLAHVLRDIAAALHVVDDLRAGDPRQDVLREEHQLPVGIDDLPVLDDDPEPVAVAVEGQANLRVRLAQAANEVLE